MACFAAIQPWHCSVTVATENGPIIGWRFLQREAVAGCTQPLSYTVHSCFTFSARQWGPLLAQSLSLLGFSISVRAHLSTFSVAQLMTEHADVQLTDHSSCTSDAWAKTSNSLTRSLKRCSAQRINTNISLWAPSLNTWHAPHSHSVNHLSSQFLLSVFWPCEPGARVPLDNSMSPQLATS